MTFQSAAHAARLLARKGLPHSSIVAVSEEPAANDQPLVAGLTQAEREAIDAAMFLDKLEGGYAKRNERRAAELERNTPPYFMGGC